jgi:hypothetical protein
VDNRGPSEMHDDDPDDKPEVGRFGRILSPWLLHFGQVIRFAIGGTLRLVADRGIIGLATVAGAIAGAGFGLCVHEQRAMAWGERE